MLADFDESEAADLAAEDRAQRAYLGRLLRHPDCRDPDHPGCELCEEPEDLDPDF